MEPDIAMTQFQSSYASHQAPTGAHVEGGLVQQVGYVPDVGGGRQVQRLEVAMDGAENLGIVVHDEDTVLVVPLDIDRVPHPEDDFLEAPEDGGAAAEIITKLYKSVDYSHGEKIPPTLGSFLLYRVKY